MICKILMNIFYLFSTPETPFLSLLIPTEYQPVGITKAGNLHVCMTCGYKSNNKSHVITHFRIKHLPQVKSSCHICHKVFKNSYYRDTHRRQAHGITNEMMMGECQVPENFQNIETDDDCQVLS